MSRLTALVSMLALATFASAGQARNALDQRVEAATEVLQQMNRMPESAIPPQLLNRAYAVAVIPNVVKGAFFIGGSHGEGILVVRRPDGSWSNPSFIRLSQGSFGFQFGGQGSDMILVFKSRKGIDDIASGKLTLGGSASVAAGPVGRGTTAQTDGEFKAEIYSYSRSRGFFAGISLEGGVLQMDHRANQRFHGTDDASRILFDDSLQGRASTRQFIDVLSAAAPQLRWQPADDSATRSATRTGDNARTFSIEEPATPAPETVF
jgi:lipid-binding SYLF domain-containing protein